MQQIIRHIIRTGGKDQSDAVTLRHHSPQKGQELPQRHSGAGFLLEIGKIFLEPAFEMMHLAGGKLVGKIGLIPEILRGKPGRSAKDTTALTAVGTGIMEIKGDLSDSMTELAAIMVTEGAEKRTDFGNRRDQDESRDSRFTRQHFKERFGTWCTPCSSRQ